MKIFATYCSAKKQNATVLIPAIERYQSPRIDYIFSLAKESNAQFIILSGKYGLLDAEQKIPYYNHLLNSNEVKEHSTLVARQLDEKGITEILFYIGDLSLDENIQTYVDCISQAADQINVPISIKLYQP